MVIDWRKHIDECLRYTKVIPTFHASAVEQHYQQLLIIKRLLAMHYEPIQILNWFLLAEDNCQKDLDEVEKLIQLSKHRRAPKNHEFKIFITAKEIEHIKKLKATKDCKAFLLSTIAYCKMMQIKKKKATFNLRERSYIYFLATGKDNYNVGAQRHTYIKKFIMSLEKAKEIKIDVKHTKYKNHAAGHIVKSITNVVFNAKWVEWDSSSGYELTDLENQMKILCDLCFEDDTLVCPKCGNEFIKTSKMKRTVCSACYEESVRKKKAIYARRMRKSNCQKELPIRWSDDDDQKLRQIYSQYNNRELREVLTKEFPNRELKHIYNHANYLGIKKWRKSK